MMTPGSTVRLADRKGPRDLFLHTVLTDKGQGLAEAACGMEGRVITPSEWEILNLPTCPDCEGAPRGLPVAAA
jgi:hypothetical protein